MNPKEEMSEELKGGSISFIGNSPMEITEFPDSTTKKSISEEQLSFLRTVGGVIAEYLKSAKRLLNGRLKHLQDWAPNYLRYPGKVLVAGCRDGVVIRYEVDQTGDMKVAIGWFVGSLSEIASALSQRLIVLRSETQPPLHQDGSGCELKLNKVNAESGERQELFCAKIAFNGVIPDSKPDLEPSFRPHRAFSVGNSLEVFFEGELLSEGGITDQGQQFITRSLIRLPVGWDKVEIFPGSNVGLWKRESAEAWAECDLLAEVVSRQSRVNELKTLDPNADSRRIFSELLDAYEALLNSNPKREEVLQVFLRDNPILLCPTFLKIWPKLALGQHVTDFVFQEASGEYLLVELEKSTDRLFVKSGHTSHKLNHARGQIQDWRRYLEDNLSSVQRELGLEGISANPRCLVVIGRAGALTKENRRKLTAIENESPKLKIVTYDELHKNTKAVVENLLGPLWASQPNTQIFYPPSNTRLPVSLENDE